MSTLGKKQEIFTRLNSDFDYWIVSQWRHEVRQGEIYRHPRMAEFNSMVCRVCKGWKNRDPHKHHPTQPHRFKAVGIKNSLHCLKLASDKLLFVNGIWQQRTEQYRELGEQWKGMSGTYRGIKVVCCWGGDFRNRPDGNHFSITHNGIK